MTHKKKTLGVFPLELFCSPLRCEIEFTFLIGTCFCCFTTHRSPQLFPFFFLFNLNFLLVGGNASTSKKPYWVFFFFAFSCCSCSAIQFFFFFFKGKKEGAMRRQKHSDVKTQVKKEERVYK